MDRIERWVERCRPVVAGALRVVIVVVWLGGAMLVASWCSGCDGTVGTSWIKPVSCLGARAAVALACGDSFHSSGGETYDEDEERVLDGPRDP